MTKRLIHSGLCVALLFAVSVAQSLGSEQRSTPLVQAVKKAKNAVVNIHSEKTAASSNSLFPTQKPRKINGMGTGIVVDERGYIVTNHHVVKDVDELRVSLHDGSTYTARVISIDRTHDLAIIKIDATQDLELMPLGISSDLMLGESVFAVGNAFGYEHTITAGIVSALSRDVEVNSDMAYRNLIQTDASINPGNSGGPLLNIDGDVVGINVAIRAGAQRIGFAIPINQARQVIAKLLSIQSLDRTFHGIVATDVKEPDDQHLKVESVAVDSPAEKAGIKPGDILKRIGKVKIVDGVDLERAFLRRDQDEPFDVVVKRNDLDENLELTLAAFSGQVAGRNLVARGNLDAKGEQGVDLANRTWNVLGVRLTALPDGDKHLVAPAYHGGMRIEHVRAGSPAAVNGIRKDDILVGLHTWETISRQNVQFVVDHPQLMTFAPLKFYILRGDETLYGHFRLVGASK